MNKTKFLLMLCTFLMLPALVVAAPEDITFDSNAEIEVERVNDKGETVLVREPAALVIPGTILIFVNTATNNGTDAAEGVIMTNPVPENTEYLAGSATETGARTTFSVDGGESFDNPDNLTVTNPDGTTRPAEAKDYTHIRWEFTEPLPPGGEKQIEFRARVK